MIADKKDKLCKFDLFIPIIDLSSDFIHFTKATPLIYGPSLLSLLVNGVISE